MLTAAIAVQLLLMIGVPLLLFWVVPYRFGTTRMLLLWGAVAFVASQAARWPFLWGLKWLGENGMGPHMSGITWLVTLCLTSGVFEEGARYIGYRTVAKDARTWAGGITYGLGHGGGEAIIVGTFVAAGAANALAYWHFEGLLLFIPDPSQRVLVAEHVRQYWAMPWYIPLLGGFERLPAICFHVAMSLVVMRAVVTRHFGWLLLAMILHGGSNAIAVVLMASYGVFAVEAALALLAIVWIAIIVRWRARPSASATT